MDEKKHHRKPRRSPSQLARDRREIAKLYLQGVLQADIAKRLELSQSTICRDIQSLQREWLANAQIDFGIAKAREIAKVDHLERIYYAAWERSCENAETVAQKQKGKVTKRKGQEGEFVAEQPAEVSKTSKGQVGDPRFLQGIQWCIDKRCKILGVDAPHRFEHTGRDGGPIETISNYSESERADTLIKLFDALGLAGDTENN